MRERRPRTVQIGDKHVGDGLPVFIVAEAGVNHFGQNERAFKLVDMAREAGADAVKIQVYDTDDMISKSAPDWRKRMKIKELNRKDIIKVKERCERRGIIFFASAHDMSSVDFLEKLGVPAFKIGSGEVKNLDFIRHVARKGRPIILSTGMYTLSDVRETVNVTIREGNTNLIILHCTTLYPTYPEEVNLRALDVLWKHFECPIGYSDHTVGYEVVLAAVARGACLIEKHIALEKDVPGTWDPIVSCDREELIQMVKSIRTVEKALGKAEKSPVLRESESLKWARKSIVSRTFIPKGTTITRNMLCIKRPGTGVPPDKIQGVAGHKAKVDIPKDIIIVPEWID